MHAQPPWDTALKEEVGRNTMECYCQSNHTQGDDNSPHKNPAYDIKHSTLPHEALLIAAVAIYGEEEF